MRGKERKKCQKKTLLLSLKEVEDLVEEERLVLYRHSVVNAPLLIIIMEARETVGESKKRT